MDQGFLPFCSSLSQVDFDGGRRRRRRRKGGEVSFWRVLGFGVHGLAPAVAETHQQRAQQLAVERFEVNGL